MSSNDESPEHRRRRELGQFLRRHRDKVQPRLHGRTLHPRRRAPGLLREEAADAAGMSVTWYTWLEQGRPMNPSARVLDGLAHALQLNAAERAHLFRLARPDLDPHAATGPTDSLSVTLVSILRNLAPHPVYAINARWDVLAWNEPAGVLFGDFAAGGVERNLLRRMLLDPQWRTLFANWEDVLVSVIAQFRATNVHVSGDPRASALIDSLLADSPLFGTLWEQREVEAPPPRQKLLNHPEAGLLTFDYATFRPDGVAEDLRLTIYTAADAHSALQVRKLLDRNSLNVSHRTRL
jgi:transcriptional regulator with XRE-family HTH domain